MFSKDEIDRLKTEISLMIWVADDLGAPQNRSSSVCMWRCPFHDDDSASFAVYSDNHFHCFGACGAHGDLIEYVQRRHSLDFKGALEFIGAKPELPKYKYKPSGKPEPKPFSMTLDQVSIYSAALDQVMPYLQSRNITREVAVADRLGCDTHQRSYTERGGKTWWFDVPYVTIPYVFNDSVYSFNSRRDDFWCNQYLLKLGTSVMDRLRLDIALKENKTIEEINDRKLLDRCFGTRFYRPGSPVTAYGVDGIIFRRDDKLIYPRRSYTILTEGEANKWSCDCIGYSSLALKPVDRINLPRLLQNVRMILLAVDPDGAGQKWATEILKRLGNDQSRVRQVVMPPGFNDMNDLHKKNSLEDVLSSRPYYLQRNVHAPSL